MASSSGREDDVKKNKERLAIVSLEKRLNIKYRPDSSRKRIAFQTKTAFKVHRDLKTLHVKANLQADYEFSEENLIGSGSYGKVYLARPKNGTGFVVIKEIDMGDFGKMNASYFLEEINIMKDYPHENVVKLITFYSYSRDEIEEDVSTSTKGKVKIEKRNVTKYKIALILEYMDLGALDEITDELRLSENALVTIAMHCFKGIAYLASKNIMHRDIKPMNILLSSKGHVKLADFGFATRLTARGSYRRTILGTIVYMAPEIYHGFGSFLKSDVWSMGVSLLAMIDPSIGTSKTARDESVFEAVCKMPRYPDVTGIEDYSKQFISIIYDQCLVMNLSTRKDATTVYNNLKALEKTENLSKTLPKYHQLVQSTRKQRRQRLYEGETKIYLRSYQEVNELKKFLPYVVHRLDKPLLRQQIKAQNVDKKTKNPHPWDVGMKLVKVKFPLVRIVDNTKMEESTSRD